MRTLVTRKGRTVNTPYSDDEACKLLVEKAKTAENRFASELAYRIEKNLYLSPEQVIWVHVLVCEDKPVSTEAFPQIRAMFDRAKSPKLKMPCVEFDLPFGKLRMKVAGDRSSKPGVIHVSAGTYGGPYYGYVDTNGNLCARSMPDDIKSFLREFEADPVGVSVSYGKRTGHCCFCRLPLSTDESLTAGYGPICAKHWKLPWGRKVGAW